MSSSFTALRDPTTRAIPTNLTKTRGQEAGGGFKFAGLSCAVGQSAYQHPAATLVTYGCRNALFALHFPHSTGHNVLAFEAEL